MQILDEITIGAPGLTALDEETWSAINALIPAANLHGFVHDTDGNPLATVSVSLNEYTTTTEPDGTFSLMDLGPGEYTITCTKAGYQDFSKSITLPAGDNEIDIKMLAEGEVEIPWLWIGIGLGAVAVIGGGIALAKKRKEVA